MKTICALAIAILLVFSSLSHVQAQNYPEKNVRFIVPWPAGGAADAVGRLIAQSLTKQMGQTVYVENIAGASGNIGTQQFVRSSKDGYTLYLATSSTNVANPHLYKKLPFKPIEDFAPISLVAVIPSVLVVPLTSPFNRPQDIVAAAQAQPGKLTYGSGGTGASAHLAGELFKSLTKIDVVHVPYKGSGPAMNDVMGGHISYMFDTGAFPFVKGGRVRALGIASDKRTSLLPDIPTFDEIGINGMYMNAWYGVAAPAGTPSVVIEKVNAALNTALTSGDLTQRLNEIGAEARGGSPTEFAAFWRSELERYAGLVALTGAVLD
jgi:tripartite-type tricarboxylate transporter receptor subunit TctC